MQWGSAADQSNVYVALSDIMRTTIPNSQGSEPDPKAGGGMFALRLDNGERVWYTPADCGDRKRCSPAQSAAVSAIPGVAFFGSVDGHLRGYAIADGKVIWDFDTVRPFDTVNKVQARGGSLNGPGPRSRRHAFRHVRLRQQRHSGQRPARILYGWEIVECQIAFQETFFRIARSRILWGRHSD